MIIKLIKEAVRKKFLELINSSNLNVAAFFNFVSETRLIKSRLNDNRTADPDLFYSIGLGQGNLSSQISAMAGMKDGIRHAGPYSCENRMELLMEELLVKKSSSRQNNTAACIGNTYE